MRRILSLLVALVLGLAPGLEAIPANALASAFASGWTARPDESSLPACCRRNGKHHCAMASQAVMSAQPQATASTRQTTDATTGETTVSTHETCPYAPRTLASTAPTLSAVIQSASASTPFPTEASTQQATATAPRLTTHRTQPTRGPPTLHISQETSERA